MSARPLIRGIAELAQALNSSPRTIKRQLADGTLQRLGLLEANRRGRIRQWDATSVEVVLFGRRHVGGLRRAVADHVRSVGR